MRAGIHRDCDVAAYHKLPGYFRQSWAKKCLDQSPLHANTPESVSELTKAKIIGDVAHAMMLGRGKTVIVGEYDDWRTKEAKEFKASAIGAGKTPILQKHFDEATAIVRVGKDYLARHQERSCFQGGDAEVALIWQEDRTKFKCLVDWLHYDLRTADDYKTTGMSVAPHAVGALAAGAGWDIQAAMIERGLNALDPAGAGRRRIRFVAQEQDAPYGLSVVVMSEYWLTMGRKKLQHAVDLWDHCQTFNEWPGYPNVPIHPEYPGWQEKRWLDREAESETLTSNLNVLAAG